ncbi:MAG TPA: hypothetical protein VGA11_03620 [Acidimicrobiia bacterium]
MAVARELIDPPARHHEVPPSGGKRAWAGHLEHWVGLAIVATCCVYVFVQFQPALLLRDTTTTGGDTGAHLWFPAFLRDHLLPSLRLSGWSRDFYAGFPAGQFYFPLPALLIVALDLFLPYNIAFKLVTALGPIALPLGAYTFARGIRLPRPAAPLLAVAATAFMFFKDGGDSTMTFDLHIMGGTLASTFAGEYSFMIALALSLFFLGMLARALDGRAPLWIPAVLLAATLMSHLVVAIFAVIAGVIVWAFRRPIANATRVLAIGAVAVLLTAVWLLPLVATLGYTTDMRYEPINRYLDWMFLGENWFLYPLGVVALVAGLFYRRKATLEIAVLTAVTGLVFVGWELVRSVLGKAPAWNLRLLPFWYLMLFLLAALGVAEMARLTALGATWLVQGSRKVAELFGVDTPGAEYEAELVAPERAEEQHRGLSWDATRIIAIALLAVIAATVTLVRIDQTRDFLPYWAKYNYTGYESGSTVDSTAKSWPEYKAFIDTANALEPGRMAWEGGDAIGAYGTPLALMLLPYWTHGRITSMEGLYFEASATTPYHFMMIATLAQTPSNPVRGIPYRTIADFNLGVQYLQLMGVRYYAAFTDQAKNAAMQNPALTQVAQVPDLDAKPPSGWNIYEVGGVSTVSPLRYQPVVVDDLHSEPNWKCEGRPEPAAGTPGIAELSPWECSAVPWFDDPTALDRPLTDGGPSDWKHAHAAVARGVVKRRLPVLDVTHVRTTDNSIDFDVSRTGVPVMVKTSYFPNWHVEGAEGPWRATPNFMVVVPTSKHVRFEYGTTTAEWAGRAGSLIGLFGLGALVWWGRQPATDGAVDGADAAAGSAGARGRRLRRRVRFPSRSPR